MLVYRLIRKKFNLLLCPAMMKSIQQVQNLYIEYHIQKPHLKESKKSEMKNDIHRLITVAIQEVAPIDLFENAWMLDILKSTLQQTAKRTLDVMPVDRAFRALEKYFLLLVQQPWKTEFKEIKMYGGFYRTRIKSVIPDCEQIFERAGYMVLPDKFTMVYRGTMNKHFLYLLALDCKVSQLECKAVTEHYSRVKGLSVTLGNVISSVLREDYSHYNPALSQSLYQKYVLPEHFSANSNCSAQPPVIPTRMPINNSSAMLQANMVGSELYRNAVDNHIFGLGDRTNEVNLPPRPPFHWSSDLSSQVLQKPQMMSSRDRPEGFNYIGNTTDEIIPELPQGMNEDHIRETLKLVNRQDVPVHITEDWRYVNKTMPGLNQFNIAMTTPYTVGEAHSNIAMQRSFKPGPSIDEGIESDLSTSKAFSFGSKLSSIGSQHVLPNKHVLPNIQQTSFDQGYRTGNPDSIYSQFSATSQMLNPQQTIYHPPNIVTASNEYSYPSKTLISRQYAGPSQIPSRNVKLTQNSDEESMFVQMSALHNRSSQTGGTKNQIHSENMTVYPSLSVPGYFNQPQILEVDHILRKNRPAVCKTSSLQTGATSNPLSTQIATARMARSMDMTTYWECPSCSVLNMSPNTICSVCSQDYIGSEVNWSERNKTQATL